MDKATASILDAISGTCIAARVRLLNRVVTNFYDDALRPLGLKVSQLNILIVTARLGLARPAQVCEILQLDASTLSRNVKPLQAHGWLEVVSEEDARAQPFRLTAQGKRCCNGTGAVAALRAMISRCPELRRAPFAALLRGRKVQASKARWPRAHLLRSSSARLGGVPPFASRRLPTPRQRVAPTSGPRRRRRGGSNRTRLC